MCEDEGSVKKVLVHLKRECLKMNLGRKKYLTILFFFERKKFHIVIKDSITGLS